VVREAICKKMFPPDDEDELTNACVLNWIARRGAYDPSRGAAPKTFLNAITRNYLIDLSRRRSLRKRRNVRLDRPIGEDGLTLGELFADHADGPEEIALEGDLRARVKESLSLLEGRDLDVAHGLMEGRRVTDVSISLGISRAACYRAKERIEKIFRDHHLQDFLR
jgi:DNA-directed RNA polymerase specialized sigma24 family protein